MDYRERMRALREDKDLTQAQVAKIINKSQQGYNHIETGRAELKIDDLIQICNSAYGNENVTINNIEHLYRNFGQKPNKIFAKEYLITCIAR